MKKEKINELELELSGLEIIDLDTFQDENFGGHNVVCPEKNNQCTIEMTK